MTITSILSNITSLYIEQNLRSAIQDSSTSALRISSGLRISKAADDPSGLSIATGLTTGITAMSAAIQNASQATSLLSVADGALDSISDILTRMKTLTVQAGVGTLTTSEIADIDAELDTISEEIARQANDATFNGIRLLDGTFTGKDFQVGIDYNSVISISLSDATATTLGVLGSSLDVAGNLSGTSSAIDNAISLIKTQRASLGATQRRFTFASATLETSVENMRAARADFLDADISAETSAFAAAQVRVSAATSILAKMNQLPANLLKLLT